MTARRPSNHFGHYQCDVSFACRMSCQRLHAWLTANSTKIFFEMIQHSGKFHASRVQHTHTHMRAVETRGTWKCGNDTRLFSALKCKSNAAGSRFAIHFAAQLPFHLHPLPLHSWISIIFFLSAVAVALGGGECFCLKSDLYLKYGNRSPQVKLYRLLRHFCIEWAPIQRPKQTKKSISNLRRFCLANDRGE